jgi:signal transduction histidine kinase
MEAAMIELDAAPVDLRELVDEVAELFAERAQRKGLELVCGIAPDVHTALRGDFGRLRQVLANLLSNAIKFTEEGEVTLRVTCRGEDEQRGHRRVAARITRRRHICAARRGVIPPGAKPASAPVPPRCAAHPRGLSPPAPVARLANTA